jgi:hypothetical protein
VRTAIVVVSLLLLAVAALLDLALVAYQRRSKRQACSIATPRPRESAVSWQAGRWDTDRRHAYVANVGAETAYEVSVTASDRVVGSAPSGPPYRAGRQSTVSELPCYVNFCVNQRLTQRIPSMQTRASHYAQHEAVDPDRGEVVVRVGWRSEHGQWHTQTVRTD